MGDFGIGVALVGFFASALASVLAYYGYLAASIGAQRSLYALTVVLGILVLVWFVAG